MTGDVEAVIESHEKARKESETSLTDELYVSYTSRLPFAHDSLRFRQKCKSFIDQYELRELHFQSLLRSKDLEIQYHIAKLDQQKRAQEVESSRSSQLTRQVSTFSQTENELRSQLNIYVEKFKQVSDALLKHFPVEDTLNSSNDLFLTFRKEMEEMSKKTKRLEKENLALTRKHEATNQSIMRMAEDRTKNQKEMDILRKRNENLEKLCRGMQAQGRGQSVVTQEHPAEAGQVALDDDEGTGSEYDDDYDDEDGSDEYDDESDDLVEQTAQHAQHIQPPTRRIANGAAGPTPVTTAAVNGVTA
ncbi:hypothetical protein BT63DRAFT_214974 [Microthyrium microscopicum]|uniref:Uncharacterized protein n=1 Tax=Microthyrium microscopicum TaxID=703497 RepID=A0A6A6UGN2_9PEZI|nr:hypothetical protein BT63DRAFT_214974 [Microthyrium microscopicum]